MGMFDDIRCKYPMPVPGANDLDYQTNDTESQWLDQYEIREDGTLWHQNYDVEDQSDLAKWRASNPGQEPPEKLTGSLSAMCGCMTAVNKRWEQEKITGEIRFYATYKLVDGKITNSTPRDGWIEWSAYFVDGKLNQLHLIENQIPNA